ncbi:MAG: CooT family nickel-binding protein [Lachnospiraceae bacterium]
MCLARVYGQKKDEEEILLVDSIAHITPEGNKIRLEDIFGDETVVEGTLLSLDLERSTVKIRLAE